MANHQLGLLLALECQRIVVLARYLSPGLLAVQQAAEARGAQFHVAADARGLSRLVTANDELVVLSDGLLADHDAARALLDRGPTVLAQPVEAGHFNIRQHQTDIFGVHIKQFQRFLTVHC